MSEMAKKARSDMKSKVSRMVRADPKTPVDASGYTPPGAIDADVQTGMRPISRRQYRRGGRIDGKPKHHAGRKPRKSGGLVTQYVNRNVKAANEERDGSKHDGGMKHGGRTHKLGGGMVRQNLNPMQVNEAQRMRPPGGAVRPTHPGMRPMMRKDGGKVHADEAQDKEMLHEMGCKCGKCSGGRVGKMRGGRSEYDANRGLAQAAMPKMETSRASRPAPMPQTVRTGNATAQMPKPKKGGGSVTDGTLEGLRPKGDRLARKHGGRSKGKMNVNIIIAQPHGGGAPPPIGGAPPTGPVGLRQGMPPPAPPPGAMPPPPVGGPPPMMRKRGGRAYPIKDGAGSGLGRLEKARA